jgi:hypothetical protein
MKRAFPKQYAMGNGKGNGGHGRNFVPRLYRELAS